jgi:hypothetical protein
MQYLILVSILSITFAYGQQLRVVDWSDGFVMKSNGELVIDKTKFDTFNEGNNQKVYTRKIKDKDGVEQSENFYVHINKDKKPHKVVSYDGRNDSTKVSVIKDSKIESRTECYGGNCNTITRNLCNSLFQYFGMEESLDVDKIYKKAEECKDIVKNLYRNHIEPHLSELAEVENDNLTWAGNALMTDSKWNALKTTSMLWKDRNRHSKVIKDNYFNLLKADSQFTHGMSGVLEIAIECGIFYDKPFLRNDEKSSPALKDSSAGKVETQ